MARVSARGADDRQRRRRLPAARAEEQPEASPTLSRWVVGEPTTETIALRRPDDRVVEVVVVAAHRGAVCRSAPRWLASFVLDECALFGTETMGAAVNAEELLRAGETRLVPGGQGWMISSPFGPSGLLYDTFAGHLGKPGRVLVVHRAHEGDESELPRRAGGGAPPHQARRRGAQYDAEWVDADSAFLEGTLVDAAVRAEPIEEIRQRGAEYVAAWDAATRGNAWTLVVARSEHVEAKDGDRREDGRRIVVACARQWIGSKRRPLDPAATIREIADILGGYGVHRVACDSWGADALKAIAKAYGLNLRDRTLSTAEAFALYDGVRTLLATSRLELPPVPTLAQDLKGLRKVALSNGVRIELPRTADGRHADFAPAVALACAAAPRPPRVRVTRGGTVTTFTSPMNF